MQPTTTPRAAANAALGEDVREWIERLRNSPAKLSYRQIADTLSAETGVTVTREALRQWHADIHASPSSL